MGPHRYKSNKTDEQIRQEAKAKAVEDLKQIADIVKLAGFEDTLSTSSGAAGLLGVAHALFHQHLIEVKSESIIYPEDDAPFPYVSVPRRVPLARRKGPLMSVPRADAPAFSDDVVDGIVDDIDAKLCIMCGEPCDQEGHVCTKCAQ